MRRWIILAVGTSGCLFNGAETEGLPCNTNADCANGNRCVEWVCGGPQLEATTEGGSDESESSGDDESATPAQDDDMDGAREECVPEDTRCIDGDTVRQCTDDGKLQTVGCPGVCGEAKPSIGCRDAGQGEQCYCAFERQPCSSEGALDCASGNQMAVCEAGWWEIYDCDTICHDAGYAGAEGCGPGESNDVCFCSSTCVENAQRCFAGGFINACFNGSWELFDCEEVCADNGYAGSLGCFEYPGEDSGCACV